MKAIESLRELSKINFLFFFPQLQIATRVAEDFRHLSTLYDNLAALPILTRAERIKKSFSYSRWRVEGWNFNDKSKAFKIDLKGKSLVDFESSLLTSKLV